jgi:hypothetical protein
LRFGLPLVAFVTPDLKYAGTEFYQLRTGSFANRHSAAFAKFKYSMRNGGSVATTDPARNAIDFGEHRFIATAMRIRTPCGKNRIYPRIVSILSLLATELHPRS